VYQLLLADSDFWRSILPLQLDQTISILAAQELNKPEGLIFVNHQHIPYSSSPRGQQDTFGVAWFGFGEVACVAGKGKTNASNASATIRFNAAVTLKNCKGTFHRLAFCKPLIQAISLYNGADYLTE